MNSESNTAYFVPAIGETGRGPGVLVLHSWWGLTPQVKRFCERLSDEGYCALAPNFFGNVALNIEAAQHLLSQAEPNDMADLVLSSIHALRTYTDDSREPIAIVGFAMGGSLGLWASARLPQAISSVVSVYGTQDIDFSESQSDYLLVKAEDDEVATSDEMDYTHAILGLADRYVESITIDDTRHGFVEELDPSYNEEASEETMDRIVAFLGEHFRAVEPSE
jgi:carboxymethylenebutenolidase